MHTAPGAYLSYAPGVLTFKTCSWDFVHSNMLLQHGKLGILLQIIYAPGAATPGYNLGSKSHKIVPQIKITQA